MNKYLFAISALCLFTIPFFTKVDKPYIQEHENLNFAVIGDTHKQINEMNAQIDYLNSKELDFVIHQGDIVNTGSELKEFDGFYDRLKHPLVIVPGNHDSDFEAVPEKIHPRKWTEFKKYFGKYYRPLEIKGYYILPTAYGLIDEFERKDMPTIIASHVILKRDCNLTESWDDYDKNNVILAFSGHSHHICEKEKDGVFIILKNYQEKLPLGSSYSLKEKQQDISATTVYHLSNYILEYTTYDAYDKEILSEGIYKLK